MPDAPDRVRSTLYTWMTKTLKEKNWTAYEWTKRANITDTALSRFLKNHKTASVPSCVTIYRLARVAGTSPCFAQKTFSEVPLVQPQHLAMFLSDLTSPQARTLFLHQPGTKTIAVTSAIYKPSDQAFALQVQTRHMQAGGVLPGDYVVVEPPTVLEPQLMSIVAVRLNGQVACFRYMRPWLHPMSTDPEHEALLMDGVTIAGVVVHLERPLLTPVHHPRMLEEC